MTETPEPVHLAFSEYGDSALLVDVLGDDYEQRWATTQAIGAALRDARLPGYVDAVASYQTVVLFFDPLAADAETLREEVRRLAKLPSRPSAPSRHDIPVRYGGADGPDLEAVAADLSMEPDDIVNLHSSTEWVVRFVGSPAGAPMMDGWSVPRSIPRLAQPRSRVEPGSIGVSGRQSTIYNAPSPGGWRLIARTPETLFDRDRTPPVRYSPGDLIRFVPIEV